MALHIWDYNEKTLKKSASGRKLLLERLINYGIFRTDRKKIPLRKVKQYWHSLHIEPKRRRALSFFIWGK